MFKQLKILCLTVLICQSNLALALDIPQGSKRDTRIQHTNYNDGDVVQLSIYDGLGSQIIFSPEEQILDVASGFSDGWEFSDRRNILYLKAKAIEAGEGKDREVLAPIPQEWDTNLLVTTNLRVYAFDLRLLKGRDDGKMGINNKVTYRMAFKYPNQEKTKQVEANKQQDIKNVLTRKNAPVNWSYTMQVGKYSESITPSLAYDDGRFTYLKFPHNRNIPVPFLVNDDNTESIVNFHFEAEKEGARKDIMVIQRVSKQIVLRHGDEVIAIHNNNYDADGIATKNGTTVNGLKRIIKEAE